MVTRISWEEQTLAIIKDARSQQQEAEKKLKQDQEDVRFWAEYADTLEKSISLRKERYKIYPNGHEVRLPEHFRQQSTWSSLRDIKESNDNLIVVRDAVTILVEAGVFQNRESATNVIYSTLYSHKKDVEKVRQGVYRFKDATTQSTQEPSKIPSKQPSPRTNTGLKEAVQQLKTENPWLTRNEVTKRLTETGFQFRSKYPNKSMAMIWVKLGYDKEGKQQPLLEVKS